MIGSIYATGKCKCGGAYKYDENQSALFCKNCHDRYNGRVHVKYNDILRRFGHDLKAAETFLFHLRHQKTTKQFDARDYSNSAPIGFKNLTDRYLDFKADEVSPKVHKSIALTLGRACKAWGHTNIKNIREGEIEDFLHNLKKRKGLGKKTVHNHKSHLHDFWKWVCRREKKAGLIMPDFPETSFALGWRKIIDIKTQQAILNEVEKVVGKNRKAFLAIRMLSRYFHIRPGELMRIKEGNINLDIPAMILPPKDAKVKDLRMIFLWDDDVEEMKKLPPAVDPSMPFFRHPAGTRAEAGKPFGQRFLYKKWTQACKNLGLMQTDTIPICDMYAGTRHSTMTELSKHMTPEQIKQASGHRTTAAMNRYLQGEARFAQKAAGIIEQMQQEAKGAKVISFKKASNGN